MTSDERREVAESLREIDKAWPTLVDDLEEAPLRFSGLAMAGILACIDDRAVFRRLADLIDPTCKDEADVNPVDGFMCSACGWWGNAQQAWSNGWGEPDFDSPTEYAIRFCPNCGARVASGDGD